MPTGLATLGRQIGHNEARVLVALLPAGQQRTVQATGAADKHPAQALPASAELGRYPAPRLPFKEAPFL